MEAVPLLAKPIYDSVSKTAVIEIFDDIDPCWGLSLSGLNEQLKSYGELQKLTVRIHSRGGNAIEGFAIFAMLEMLDTFIRVEIIGIAASAASVIAMAGDERVIADTGQLMIHDPWVYTAGNSARLRRDAERLDVIRPGLIRAYKRHVKSSPEELSAWMSNGEGAGTWFDADRCLELGFATEIFQAPVPQNRIRLDDIEGVPESALQFFSQVPEPSPTEPKTLLEEVLMSEGETPEAVAVYAAMLDELNAQTQTPASLTARDLDLFEVLFATQAVPEEMTHGC